MAQRCGEPARLAPVRKHNRERGMFLRLHHEIPGMRIGAGRGYPFSFLRSEELGSLICALSFETSSRSAASSSCTPADPGSLFDSLDSLPGAGAGGRRAERGIHGESRLAAVDAAVGRTEVK